MPLYDFGLTSQIEYSKNTQKLFRKVETQDTRRNGKTTAVYLIRVQFRTSDIVNIRVIETQIGLLWFQV